MGVSFHDREVGADVRGQVRLVDDEQIGAGDARASLAGHLVSPGDIDDEDLAVDQPVAKCGSQIVTTGFDKNQIEITET